MLVTILEVHLGEDDHACEVVGEVMYVWHGVAIRDGDVIQPLEILIGLLAGILS